MNGGKEGSQNSRLPVGRTTYSRINFDALDLIVRPARGRYNVPYIYSPGRSGFALRRGGYNKSDLSEVLSRLSSTSYPY